MVFALFAFAAAATKTKTVALKEALHVPSNIAIFPPAFFPPIKSFNSLPPTSDVNAYELEKLYISEGKAEYAKLCSHRSHRRSAGAHVVTAQQRAKLLNLGDSSLPPQDPDDVDSIADCIRGDILPATLGPVKHHSSVFVLVTQKT